SVAMKKASERLGIVYTPTEIVEFILRSVDHILREQFDSSIGAEGVHVLDPFTGTGTFIAELIHSDLISDADLPRKFRKELHANEINLLAYYVAAVNIEEAYHSRMGGNYVPFPGVLLTDTFQMFEGDDELDHGVFPENNARFEHQKQLPITVVVGNPPYSVGQKSANDDNQAIVYTSLRKRIDETYANRSTASLTKSLYDSYIGAIRWASDRIGDRGVIGFVTNGGFIESNSADGMRKALAEEFSDLYMFNLRGNQRTAGEQSRKEGGKVFGAGSRATIVVALFVKNPDAETYGALHYRDVGDYLTREQKLSVLKKFHSANAVPWENVAPNDDGDWISQRNEEFETFTPIGPSIFRVHSRGVLTARDVWAYDSSKHALDKKMRSLINVYNDQVDVEILERNPAAIKWDGTLITRAQRGESVTYQPGAVQPATYRPFFKQHIYFDRALNNSVYQMPKIFARENLGFYVVGMGSAVPFSVVASSTLVDVHLTGAGSGGQFFPRYSYEKRVTDENQLSFEGDDADEYTRVDNVTDGILAEYRATYGAASDREVTKDDIFFYVYGLLHSPEYRERFAADLKKMLPRIPKVTDFWGFAEAGRRLSELHLGYETIEPWPLEEVVDGEVVSRRDPADRSSTTKYLPNQDDDRLEPADRSSTITHLLVEEAEGRLETSSTRKSAETDPGGILHVKKMTYGGKRPKLDESRVIVNERLELRGIPDEAHDYMLGSRSALDWILERYQIKTDKASGIVNDPNDWGREHGDPRYIVDLVKRITVAIVKSLPPLDILDAAPPETPRPAPGVSFS
ncbi:MAG TPA: damage-inducible protein, partial [Terrimesophilobacter sp.]|nr:damage-inducible protein [Terrimesophilobacter sp.]